MLGFKTIAKMRLVSRIGIGLTTLAISTLLLFSYYGEQVGQFTIDINQDLYLENRMVLSESIDFEKASSRLIAEPLDKVKPIGYYGEPEKIPIQVEATIEDLKDGSNNGNNFFAYSFYVKNDGTQAFSYNMSVFIEDATNHADEAIRIMVIKNLDVAGEKIYSQDVYAKKQSSIGSNPGSPEIGTTMFINNRIVVNENRLDFEVGQIDRYIVIMWLHGEDADCIDIGDRSITDGLVKLSMQFNVVTA